MGFFEYLSNNLGYLFIVLGALVLVIGGSILGYFILKNWNKIFKSKKKDCGSDCEEAECGSDNQFVADDEENKD